jgi:hypothetical protein
MMNVPLTATP